MHKPFFNPVFAVITGSALLAASANAATLYTDDFESDTVNSLLPKGTDYAQSTLATVRDAGTATPFGASNKYLQLDDTSATLSTRIETNNIAGAFATLTTFSFDFYEASSGGASSMIFGYSLAGKGLDTNGHRVRAQLNDGTIGGLTTAVNTSYSLDTAYRMNMIFNDTASSANYDGGSISSGSADLWITALSGGPAVYVGNVTANNTPTASYRVGFRTFSSFVQEVWVDNVSLEEGAVAVPEPSGVALLGLGASLLVLRRRRS